MCWPRKRAGVRVTMLERDVGIGGLAGSFTAGGVTTDEWANAIYPA